MPTLRNPLNILGAAGVCASLALLGWDIHAHDRVQTRVLSLTIDGTHDSQDDDAIVPAPDEERRHGDLDDHSLSPNDRRDDDDFDDAPIKQPDNNVATPI
ncbi:MAG TPA: hypothetical protein VKB71_10430 [Rhizomicrobium sp.]|nr:hypothetical protein [Rhizomicrobium sp.]